MTSSIRWQHSYYTKHPFEGIYHNVLLLCFKDDVFEASLIVVCSHVNLHRDP